MEVGLSMLRVAREGKQTETLENNGRLFAIYWRYVNYKDKESKVQTNRQVKKKIKVTKDWWCVKGWYY